jgi:hypothetical protein
MFYASQSVSPHLTSCTLRACDVTDPILLQWAESFFYLSKLLKKSPAYYGPLRFTIMVTRVCHWPLFQAGWIEATHFHPHCSRSILMACPCHHLGYLL